jgi:hypothetical protein
VILDHLIVLKRIGINETDPPPTSKLELVQMTDIPARKRRIDRIRQRRERVRRPHDEDPTRRRPQPPTKTPKKINPNLKPRPRHRHRTLRNRF